MGRHIVVEKATGAVINAIEYDPAAHPDFVPHENMVNRRSETFVAQVIETETGDVEVLGQRDVFDVVENVILVASEDGEIGWQWDGTRPIDPQPPTIAGYASSQPVAVPSGTLKVID